MSLLYQRIAQENPAPFRTPLTWFSNGERGHLHHTQYCDKIARSRVATVNRQLTLAEALKRNVCQECLGRGDLTGEQREVVDSANEFIRLERGLGMMHPNPLTTDPEGAVATYRSHLFFAKAKELGDAIDGAGHLPHMKRAILERISIPDRPGDEALREETLHFAAGQTFWKLLSQDDAGNPYWGGREIIGLLGVPTWRDWSQGREASNTIVRTGRIWTDMIQARRTPREATEALLGSLVSLRTTLVEPTWEMLERCSDLELPQAGEDLRTYANRVWRERALNAIMELVVIWEELATRLVADAEPVVLASDSLGGRGVANMVCGTEPNYVVAALQRNVIRASERQDRMAIVCHPTVGEYLSRVSGRSGWSDPVPAPKGNLDEALETALALWDPWSRDGSYRTFPQALEAAEHLEV